MKKCIKNRFFINFFIFLGVFFTIFILFLINLKFNYGEFRFYTIFCYFLAFIIERFIFTNILATNADLCYNKIDEEGKGENKNIERKIKKRIKFKRRKNRKNKG